MFLIISFLNLILSFYFGYKRYIGKSINSLYWFGSLFFIGLPLFLDSMMVFLNKGDVLTNFLYDQDINFYIDFNKLELTYLSLFVLFCNLAFMLGELVIVDKKSENHANCGQFEYILLILNYLFLFIFLFNYPGKWFVADFYRESNFLYQFSALFVMICSSSALIYLMNRKYILGFFSLFPTLFISFVSAERPYLAPFVGVLFIWMATISNDNKKDIFKILLFGFFAVFIMRFVRYLANGQDFSLLQITLERDSSTSVLYYIFENVNIYESLVNGKATLFLILTGIYPEFLLGSRNFSLVDIPAILAQDKFGWSFGTIHPTLYGWLFIDLGWVSIFFMFMFGLILRYMENFLKKKNFRMYSIFLAAASVFIFVALRGSLQVGYSRFFYILIIGLFLVILYNILAKKYPKRKK